jgi:hypothetical protein
MDASLPTGKELRPLNAKSMNSRLSGRETSVIEVDPLMDTASKCPWRDKQQFSLTP